MQMRDIFRLLLAVTVLLSGCSASVESVGGTAPDFTLQDINDRTVRLSDYGNRVVILNFFATWCPPCRSEIPDFVELMNKYGDRDFVIIGISLDRGDPGTVRNFANQNNINYPVLLDNGLVSDQYGPILSIPTAFIIDKKGNILEKLVGSRDKDYFEGKIKPLL